jgi:hypothetical protein
VRDSSCYFFRGEGFNLITEGYFTEGIGDRLYGDRFIGDKDECVFIAASYFTFSLKAVDAVTIRGDNRSGGFVLTQTHSAVDSSVD